MKGYIENGGVAYNKADAIELAKRELERQYRTGEIYVESPWVYVFKADGTIWFSVGYVKRSNVSNYVQIKPKRGM